MRPVRVDSRRRRTAVDLRLRAALRVTAETSPDAASQLFEDAFAAVWSGAAESDGFNALVLHAGLNWRQVVPVRVRQVSATGRYSVQ